MSDIENFSKALRHPAEKFLIKLREGRGAIVSSGDCTNEEIIWAKAFGSFYVDDEGFGYVIRSRNWLEKHERQES